ncbi:MAG TPA: EamA family transporter, partial [Steroidobacteraceae bacterium]
GSAWLLLGGAPATGQAASRETRASFIRVLVATVSVGIANFIYSLGLRAGATPGTLITTQAAVVVALSSSFVALTERAIRPSTAALRHAPVAALVLAAAFMLMVESMARGEASVSVPIAQMGFVVTAVLGFLVLGERFTARKGLGIVAAVGALASLAHG